MGQSVVVDTSEMKQIVGANSAIASSVIALFKIADKLPAGDEATALRSELNKVLKQAERIQASVTTVIRENRR